MTCEYAPVAQIVKHIELFDESVQELGTTAFCVATIMAGQCGSGIVKMARNSLMLGFVNEYDQCYASVNANKTNSLVGAKILNIRVQAHEQAQRFLELQIKKAQLRMK